MPAPGGAGVRPELPTWRETTVSVSTTASMIGSQCDRSHNEGSPISCGRSGKVTDVKPRAALRRISSTASAGSARYVMPSGTMRSGCGEYHSSKSQSFHARTQARPRSRSAASKKTRPQNPVIMDGKFTDAHTPLMSMSRTRASTS